MDNIETTIKANLSKYNIGIFDDFKPLLKKQLLEIEEYIQRTYQTRLEAIKTYKDYSVSIFSISKNTSVSKATIYNNPNTLKKYIEIRIKDFELQEKGFYDKDKVIRLEETITEQQLLLDNTATQFIEMNNLKITLNELGKEIERKDKTIEYLTQTNIQLEKELQKLRKEILKSNTVVTKLK